MMSIEQLIGDLLLQNNCVIIPSFGGFVAQQISAKIDFKTGKAYPPSKSLLFNKQLINNDGLLINELAKINQLTFDKASLEVTEKVTQWQQVIKAGGRIELDRIGILYNDTENNLCFEQDRFFNLLLASFGLERVHFVTEEDVQIIEKTIAFEDQQSIPVIAPIKKETNVIEHPVLVNKKRNAWKYVAAACFLPIAFYSIWIPMKTDVLESGMISFQDFNPFHKTEVVQYQKESSHLIVKEGEKNTSISEQVKEIPQDVTVYSYKYDDELYIPVTVQEELNEAESQEIVPTISTSDSFSAVELNYIVGCFGDKSNAENLVDKLNNEGFEARIVDFHNGLHRVSAGSAISVEQINQIKTSAIALGLKGWTLK